MRVLVTGGLGFTGRAVADNLLAGGHRVTVMTSRQVPVGEAPPGADVVQVDLREAAPIRDVVVAGGFDAVCHLAALTRVRDSFADPIGYYDVNVAGTIHLLAALDDAATRSPDPPRLVFASTAAVYGAANGRLTEDQPTAPTNPYGTSKLAAERLLVHQAATGRLGVTILRCLNIAGGYDGHHDPDATRIIPKTLAVAHGDADHVTVNGDGAALREYTHVLDAAEAFRLAVEASPTRGDHHVYNVGTGVGISVSDVITAARALTGHSIEVRHAPPQPEPQTIVADATRIRRDLGWHPRRSTLDEILKDGWSALQTSRASG